MAVATRKEQQKNVNYQYMKDRDSEIVKGRFHYHEQPNNTLDFSYKCYRGQQIEAYHLKDGEIYEIPLGVARHLNKSGRYPIHAYKLGEDDKPSLEVGYKVARYSFESLEFADISDTMSPDDLVPEIKEAV